MFAIGYIRMGNLSVYVNELRVFHRTGHQGDTWMAGQIVLNGSNLEIKFEGTIGGSRSNIGLDDFILTDTCNISWLQPVNGSYYPWGSWSECTRLPSKPPCGIGAGTRTRRRYCSVPSNGGVLCSGQSTQGKYCNLTTCPVDNSMACNFDLSFCGWQHSSKGGAQWHSSNTKYEGGQYGPLGDHTTGQGYYMSVDSSHVFWTSAHFEYSQNITGSLCFTFHYHMAQFEAGSLWLLLDDHVVFEDHNGHGNQWIKVQITLHGNNSKVSFKAEPFVGVIAIDDFNVSEQCSAKSIHGDSTTHSAAVATSVRATATGKPIVRATGSPMSTSARTATGKPTSSLPGSTTDKLMAASIQTLPASVTTATGRPMPSSATTTDTGTSGPSTPPEPWISSAVSNTQRCGLTVVLAGILKILEILQTP